MKRKASASFIKPKSTAASGQRSSIFSKSSNASSSSSASTISSDSSGASVGSWDPRGRVDGVTQDYILVNDRMEDVAFWYDNADVKPLPGQHRLRDGNGKVITAVEAAKDRKLKETLKFTGLAGKKNRLTFQTVDNAVETATIDTLISNPWTGETRKGLRKETRVPDFSRATGSEALHINQQARRLSKPKSILVDGKKVKPSRYYDNGGNARTSVVPLPGQEPIHCAIGNYAEHAVADYEKRTKSRLNRYVGLQKRGPWTMHAFRTASYDDSMGGVGRPVDFMLHKK